MIFSKNNKKTSNELLKEFVQADYYETSKVNLIHNTGKDVYNITAPFTICDDTYIAGRLEGRETEFSEIAFFIKQGDNFLYIEELNHLKLQDPFVTFISGELVLGGVEVVEALEDNIYCKKGMLIYKTVFYKGKTIYDLKYFAEGPTFMKDIRLLQVNDRILVLTRPQGKTNGRGKIGAIWINDLSELTISNIENATILENQFIEEEWGGANEMHLLSNGLIGVLSHIGSFDKEGNRHYYSTAFCLNPNDFSYSPQKIIAKKSMFNSTSSKRSDLYDVVFSGGIIRLPHKQSTLFCGVSDSEAHYINIKDPFTEYEEELK